MRVVLQRVKKVFVLVDKKLVSEIGRGALIFLAVHKDDSEKDLLYLTRKVLDLRFFSDVNNKMNLSIKDIKGKFLVISQFTLYGDCTKGKRPSFTLVKEPKEARKFYEEFIDILKKEVVVERGIFGENMEVNIINDGPVTFVVDSFCKKN